MPNCACGRSADHFIPRPAIEGLRERIRQWRDGPMRGNKVEIDGIRKALNLVHMELCLILQAADLLDGVGKDSW